jgi:hypothetical protein
MSLASHNGGTGRGSAFGTTGFAAVFSFAAAGLLFAGVDNVTVGFARTGLAAAAAGRASAWVSGTLGVTRAAVLGFDCGALCFRLLPAVPSALGRTLVPVVDLPLLALICFIPFEKVPPFGSAP